MVDFCKRVPQLESIVINVLMLVLLCACSFEDYKKVCCFTNTSAEQHEWLRSTVLAMRVNDWHTMQ